MKKFIAAMVIAIVSAVVLVLSIVHHEVLMTVSIAGFCLIVIGASITLVASFGTMTEDLY